MSLSSRGYFPAGTFACPLVVAAAPFVGEARQFAFGRTDAGRLLTVAVTMRGSLLRVISVRPMSRRERKGYGKANDA